MKKVVFLLLALFTFFAINLNARAFVPLDRILEYNIFINPTEEGNLNMTYKIKWQVLDSNSEGPLEWVKIGVPNKYVNDLKALSSQIDEISYYSDGGAYIRCDLDRSYYEGEIVDISFSFLQTHIYTFNDTEVIYRFNPGWFDEIKVDSLKVYWNKANVIYNNANSGNSVYYIWDYSLSYGETINVDVKYNSDNFINISKENSYSNAYLSTGDIIGISIIVGAVVIVIITLIIVCWKKKDDYYGYRGFSGYRYHYWWYHLYGRGVNKNGDTISDPRIINSSTGGHSGGSSCACACACACAGGGRAGCSRKDFYNPNLKIDEFIDKNKEYIIE